MKISKKAKAILSSLVALSVGATIAMPFLFNNKNVALNINNASTKTWNGGGASAESEATFDFKTADELKATFGEDYKAKSPKDITADDVKNFLKVTNGTASNWTVSLIEPTQEDITKGVVRFKLYQNIRQQDGTVKNTLIKYKNGNTTGTDEWTTEGKTQLSNYILSSLYKFEWASDSELTKLFSSGNISTDVLNNKTWVLNNLVSSNSILPSEDKITVNTETVGTDGDQYGVKKVKINFDNTQDSDWSGNQKPDITSLERIIRGFTPVGANTNEMTLQFDTNGLADKTFTQLDGTDSTKYTIFDNTGATKVGDLTASQFVSPIDNTNPTNQSVLLDMLTKGIGLEGSSGIVSIQYMGKKTTDADFDTSTGLSNGNTTYKITKVRTIPNDTEGSLRLIYTFDCLDIYTNKTVEKTVIQDLPAGTFKTSTDSNKVLEFSWKTDNAVTAIGGTYDIVNNFMSNQTDETYVRLLSNKFFNGTTDAYQQPRTVTIAYGSGNKYNDATKKWEPSGSTNDTTLKVTIVFDEWSGASYTDTDETVKKGFKAERTFDLAASGVANSPGSYKIENNDVVWKTNAEFLVQNPEFAYKTPTTIVNDVKTKNSTDDNRTYDLSVFFTTPNNNTINYDDLEVSLIPNNEEGSIEVTVWFYEKVTNGATTTKNYLGCYFMIYTGMQKSVGNADALEFSWISSTEISPELLAIPIDEVTKTDIMEYYLKKIPMFANNLLTENNVTFEIIGDSTIRIDVTISSFDQANPLVETVDQKFYTTISGFTSSKYKNTAELIAPEDLTAVISLPIAATITCVLSVVLIAMISKRARIRKFKNTNPNKTIKK